MKAITIKQPWAHLICSGIKDIENRTWPTKFRGLVLVHASAKSSGKMIDLLTDEQYDYVKKSGWKPSTDMPLSAIIGSVEIVDCFINYKSIWAEKTDGYDFDSPIIYNWVLKNPIMFPEPIPAKGRLSFWDYPNILAKHEEMVGESFCHCQIQIDEKNQVAGDIYFGYNCRYCGGKWYK